MKLYKIRLLKALHGINHHDWKIFQNIFLIAPPNCSTGGHVSKPLEEISVLPVLQTPILQVFSKIFHFDTSLKVQMFILLPSLNPCLMSSCTPQRSQKKKLLSCFLKQAFTYWVTCVSFCIFRPNKSIPSTFHHSLRLLNLLFLSLPFGLLPICLHLSYRAHSQFQSQYLKPC